MPVTREVVSAEGWWTSRRHMERLAPLFCWTPPCPHMMPGNMPSVYPPEMVEKRGKNLVPGAVTD